MNQYKIIRECNAICSAVSAARWQPDHLKNLRVEEVPKMLVDLGVLLDQVHRHAANVLVDIDPKEFESV